MGPGQRVRDSAHRLQLEVVLAAHRRIYAGKVGMDILGIGHGVLLMLYGVNFSEIQKSCSHSSRARGLIATRQFFAVDGFASVEYERLH